MQSTTLMETKLYKYHSNQLKFLFILNCQELSNFIMKKPNKLKLIESMNKENFKKRWMNIEIKEKDLIHKNLKKREVEMKNIKEHLLPQ